MFLSRVVYYSTHAPLSEAELADIVRTSASRNYLHNITGALFHDRRWFVQVLEGARKPLSALLMTIARDPRHSGMTLVEFRSTPERRFANWAMRRVVMGPPQIDILKTRMPDGFDPSLIADGGALVEVLRELAFSLPVGPVPAR